MDNIILIGAGGHCKSILDSIKSNNEFNVYGIIDKAELIGKEVYGEKIIGTDDDLEDIFNEGIKNAFIAVGSIGNPKVRKMLYEKVKSIGFNVPIIKDKTAIVAEKVQIGSGTYIGKRTVVNSDSYIGENCIINTGAIIEHDCKIGDAVHVAPGAVVCGGVTIKDDSHIGCNATIIQGITIEEASIIGAGAVVIKNIEPRKKVVGNPSREV